MPAGGHGLARSGSTEFRPTWGLGDDFVDNVAMNVGQTEISAGMAIGEAFVIDAHEMQNRGVQIVD